MNDLRKGKDMIEEEGGRDGPAKSAMNGMSGEDVPGR